MALHLGIYYYILLWIWSLNVNLKYLNCRKECGFFKKETKDYRQWDFSRVVSVPRVNKQNVQLWGWKAKCILWYRQHVDAYVLCGRKPSRLGQSYCVSTARSKCLLIKFCFGNRWCQMYGIFLAPLIYVTPHMRTILTTDVSLQTRIRNKWLPTSAFYFLNKCLPFLSLVVLTFDL